MGLKLRKGIQTSQLVLLLGLLIIQLISSLTYSSSYPFISLSIISLIGFSLIIYIKRLIVEFSSYLVIDDKGLLIQTQDFTDIIPFDKVDEVFYIVQLNETGSRTYELPDSYLVISDNRQITIDLRSFSNEIIVSFNMELEHQIGSRFTKKERFIRKVSVQSEFTSVGSSSEREFIQLDLIDQ